MRRRRRRRRRSGRIRGNRRVTRGEGASRLELLGAIPVLLGIGMLHVFGEFAMELLVYALPLGAVVLAVYVVARVVMGAREDDRLWREGQRAPRRRREARRIARTYTVATTPPSRIEVDPAWPGRTRVRIPAPTALPMLGPARFVSAQGLRAKRYESLRWEGEGRDDARRWSHLFDSHFRAIRRAAGKGGFSVTLNSAGLLIHMPFVVPREHGIELLERHATLLSAVMAGIAEREEWVLGLNFVEVEAQHTADCSCCWTAVDAADAVICPVCGGMQHHDCAEWAGGCARFACAGELPSLERDTAA